VALSVGDEAGVFCVYGEFALVGGGSAVRGFPLFLFGQPCCEPLGVSDERCKWPNTLSCGLARKGRDDRNTVGRESTIIEGTG
jgi:hypothetical protein